MTNRKPLSQPIQKALLMASGNQCAICKRTLTVVGDQTGEINTIVKLAHIYPNSKDGPRKEEIITDNIQDDFIDSYENIIALCSGCHDKVDGLPRDYPAKKLLEIKQEHENNVKDVMTRQVLDVTIQELSLVCDAILSNASDVAGSQSSDFSMIAVKNKITKNNLTSKIEFLITTGLAAAHIIDNFLSNQPDVNFTDRLVLEFKKIYASLAVEYTGDDLYMSMLGKLAPANNPLLNSATNSVISYLFQKCEIFEK